MKKCLILLTTLALILTLPLSFGAMSIPIPQEVSDEASVLSESEETQLTFLLRELQKKYGVFVMVSFSETYATEHTAQSVAAREYKENHLDEPPDGVIFFVSIPSRVWNIQGLGAAYNRLNKDAMDRLEDRCLPHLKEDHFATAATVFVETLEEILLATEDGSAYKAPFPLVQNILFALAIGLVIAGIAVLAMVAQLKSVHSQNAARNYQKQGSLNVTRHGDLFLYRTLTRIPRPKNNSSGGNRSGGGSRSGRF